MWLGSFAFCAKVLSTGHTNLYEEDCDMGHSPCLAFDYISRSKKNYKSNEMQQEKIIDINFLEKIDPDFTIIEWFLFFSI